MKKKQKNQNLPARKAKEKPEAGELKLQHKLFAEAFVGEAHGSITQAALLAGYNPKSAPYYGSKLLKNTNIAAYIEKLRIRDQETAGITKREWLQELKRIGFSDITGFLEFGPGYVTLKDSKTLLPDQTRAIAEVSETVTSQGGSTVRFKLHDKPKALDGIGKHFGWLKETPCDPKNAKPLVIINRIEIVENSSGQSPKPVIEIGS